VQKEGWGFQLSETIVVTKPMAKLGEKASEPDLNQLLNEVYDAIERLAKLSVELEGVWASL